MEADKRVENGNVHPNHEWPVWAECVVCFDSVQDPMVHYANCRFQMLKCTHMVCSKGCLELLKNSQNELKTFTHCPRCLAKFTDEDIHPKFINPAKLIDLCMPKIELKRCTFCIQELEAVSWCEECGQFLCQFCSDYHPIQSRTLTHILSNELEGRIPRIDETGAVPPEKIAKIDWCALHKKKCSDVYCCTCAKKLCPSCLLSHDNSHQLSDWEDLVKETIRMAKDYWEKSEKIVELCTFGEADLEEKAQHVLNQEKDELIAEARSQILELLTKIVELEMGMRKEISQAVVYRAKRLNARRAEFKGLHMAAKQFTMFVKNVLDTKDESVILEYFGVIKFNYEAIEKMSNDVRTAGNVRSRDDEDMAIRDNWDNEKAEMDSSLLQAALEHIDKLGKIEYTFEPSKPDLTGPQLPATATAPAAPGSNEDDVPNNFIFKYPTAVSGITSNGQPVIQQFGSVAVPHSNIGSVISSSKSPGFTSTNIATKVNGISKIKTRQVALKRTGCPQRAPNTNRISVQDGTSPSHVIPSVYELKNTECTVEFVRGEDVKETPQKDKISSRTNATPDESEEEDTIIVDINCDDDLRRLKEIAVTELDPEKLVPESPTVVQPMVDSRITNGRLPHTTASPTRTSATKMVEDSESGGTPPSYDPNSPSYVPSYSSYVPSSTFRIPSPSYVPNPPKYSQVAVSAGGESNSQPESLVTIATNKADGNSEKQKQVTVADAFDKLAAKYSTVSIESSSANDITEKSKAVGELEADASRRRDTELNVEENNTVGNKRATETTRKMELLSSLNLTPVETTSGTISLTNASGDGHHVQSLNDPTPNHLEKKQAELLNVLDELATEYNFESTTRDRGEEAKADSTIAKTSSLNTQANSIADEIAAEWTSKASESSDKTGSTSRPISPLTVGSKTPDTVDENVFSQTSLTPQPESVNGRRSTRKTKFVVRPAAEPEFEVLHPVPKPTSATPPRAPPKKRKRVRTKKQMSDKATTTRSPPTVQPSSSVPVSSLKTVNPPKLHIPTTPKSPDDPETVRPSSPHSAVFSPTTFGDFFLSGSSHPAVLNRVDEHPIPSSPKSSAAPESNSPEEKLSPLQPTDVPTTLLSKDNSTKPLTRKRERKIKAMDPGFVSTEEHLKPKRKVSLLPVKTPNDTEQKPKDETKSTPITASTNTSETPEVQGRKLHYDSSASANSARDKRKRSRKKSVLLFKKKRKRYNDNYDQPISNGDVLAFATPENGILSVFPRLSNEKMKITDIDDNEDYCGVCRDGGEDVMGHEMICCDHCPKVFHWGCHMPSLISFPEGDFQCNWCRSVEDACDVNNQSELFLRQDNVSGLHKEPEEFYKACKFLSDLYKLDYTHLVRDAVQQLRVDEEVDHSEILDDIRLRLTTNVPKPLETAEEMITELENMLQLFVKIIEESKIQVFMDILPKFDQQYTQLLKQYYGEYRKLHKRIGMRTTPK